MMGRRGKHRTAGGGGEPLDAAAFAAAVARAWAEGERGWEALAEAWSAPRAEREAPEQLPLLEEAPAAARCWWDGPPWYGHIADDEFRAIVVDYIARYGEYTPDLPEREPALLRAWLRGREEPAAPPPQAAA